MAKFLIRARFTVAGIQGSVKEGFVAREAYVRSFIESVGARAEGFYFAYGEDDILVIADGEPAAAIAISLAVNQSGAVKVTTTPLLTSAEMDEARARLPQYRPPGA